MNRVITIKPGQNAEDITTKRLLRGLYVGFNFVFFEQDAVKELVRRGETEAVLEAYQKSTRKMSRAAIARVLGLKYSRTVQL